MKRAIFLTLICLGFYGGLAGLVVTCWNSLQSFAAAVSALCVLQSLYAYMEIEKR